MKKKIRVGYLPLYIKLYDDDSPKMREPLVEYMKMLIKMLESQGIEVVQVEEVCRIKPEFDRAAIRFNEAGVDAVITQHLAYSPSLESIEALLSLDAPIIVFDTTPDYELIKVAGYENRIDANHGIHGVQDMCNLLLRNGKPYFVCAGHALHSDVLSRVVGLCRAAKAAKAYQTMTIGSVGGSFTGMGDFQISDERYADEIGAKVKYMTPDLVEAYLEKVEASEIDAEMTDNAAKYDVQVNNTDNYRAAIKSGLAIRKWMEEEGMGACSVNFLTLDICGLPKMPFVECCKIMERGQGYAGEGDVLTAGLVGALMQAYPNTTFTEMFCPDWEQDVILLSHMGESNPKLSQWKPHLVDRPFSYNSTGDTVAMFSCYRPGKAVYVNLAPMNDGFHLIVSEVDLLACGLERSAYSRSNQGWMKPCKPLPDFLEEYSMYGGTHHSAMVYDADIKEIKAFGQMMGFKVIEIKP